jgi:nuclear pore complex protein Nup93
MLSPLVGPSVMCIYNLARTLLSSNRAPSPRVGIDHLLSTMSQAFGGFGSSQSRPSALGSQLPVLQSTGAFTGLNTSAAQPTSSSSVAASLLHQENAQLQPVQQHGQKSAAYFDSLLEKSRKRVHGETALEELPSLQLGLNDLRQRIRKLGTTVQGQGVNGRARHLLSASGADPGSAVRDLSYFDTQSTKIERTQPTITADTDIEGYLNALQSQTTLSMIAEGLSRSVRDFDTFVEENVTMEWDAQRKRIYQHFGIKPGDGYRRRDGSSLSSSSTENQGGFGRSRRGKGNSLSGPRTNGTPSGSVFGRSSMQRSVIGAPGPIGIDQQTPFVDVERKGGSGLGASSAGLEDQFLRERQTKFAEKVQNLNVARLQRQNFPLLQEFASVEAQGGDQHAEHVVKAYNAVIEMIGENISHDQSEEFTLKERCFAEAYLDENPVSAKAVEMRKTILAGANRHFEKQFFQELEVLVAKNPREANLGGVPNVLSKVKAYIRIRAAHRDLVPDNTPLQSLEDDYVWALIFFLLRSGHIKEATEYVATNAVAFRALDRNFVTYITAYHRSREKRLPRELQDRINNEYNQRVRIAPEHSIDPFRMACYKIIGRCEIEKRDLAGINQSMEDWVWLQFNLAREVSRVDEIASEVYGLAEVQSTIRGIGARHFSKGGTDQFGGFGIYFYLQVLAGLFEDAVKYLYTFQYVDGVHFAIGLDYYGFLRVSDLNAPIGELLTHSTRSSPQINFAQMIGYYTRDFRTANVVTAVDYLTLLCLNRDLPGDAGRQQLSQCHEALRELVLETREFTQLLGDVRADGQRIPGAIEERKELIGLVNADDYMRTVIIQAASIASDNGRTTDSVLLYHLAAEYDNVITIINRALSDALTVEIGQETTAHLYSKAVNEHDPKKGYSISLTSVDDPTVLAQRFIDIYNSNRIGLESVGQQNRDTCKTLLAINQAKYEMQASRWTQALDVSFYGPHYL